MIYAQTNQLTNAYCCLIWFSVCALMNVSAQDLTTTALFLYLIKLKGEWKPGQKTPPRFVLTTVSVSSQVMIKIQAPK